MRTSRILVPATLLVLAAAAPRSPEPRPTAPLAPHPVVLDSTRYEIVLKHVGYSGLASNPDCDAITNRQGYDSLVGIVGGMEQPPEPNEDMEYAGIVKRRTRIDYCLLVGPDGNQKWCVATLRGIANMTVHITVYGEQGRGAWVKADPAPGPVDSLSMQGGCEPDEMDEIKRDYPSGESAGSPSGQPIEESPAKPFFANGLARLRAGAFYPAKPPESAWSLRVVRAVP